MRVPISHFFMVPTGIQIVKKLRTEGFEAYFAGGFVRDLLLGREHKDVDIATSAKPEEVEELFSKTYPVGKSFGVVHIIEGDHQFEVATFRKDSPTSDGRRPKYVAYGTLEEDAERRDFTINGMYYDPIEEKVIDLVGGEGDLRERVIRFIGDPKTRIHEDYLRLLRAVRFAHQIQGQYEPKTYEAVKELSSHITTVSWERIRDEINKMLLSSTRAEAMEDLQDLGLLSHTVPELEKLKGVAQPRTYHKEGSVWNHAMQAIKTLKAPFDEDIRLIWGVLLHDIGKPETFHVEERIRFDGHAEASARIAREVLTRLRFPKRDVEHITWAVEHHMSLFHLLGDRTSEVRKRKWFLHPAFPLLLEIHHADILGTSPHDLSSYRKLMREYKRFVKKHGTEFAPLVGGKRIMEWTGLKQGKELGALLEDLKEKQLLGEHKKEKDVRSYILDKYKKI